MLISKKTLCNKRTHKKCMKASGALTDVEKVTQVGGDLHINMPQRDVAHRGAWCVRRVGSGICDEAL
jgi:hypothetical protein